MFCDKIHVNQLTALLKSHEICDIVVCPGSRNGILVHNFEVAKFHLYPITDERSAAFVALGICLRTRRAVAVCVTSGSALLNTIPAVAEAFYRQLPLLVISADRPKQWINQLDGQTIPQNGALLPYAQTFNIEESSTQEEYHWNELQMNQALLSLYHNGMQPVHINVPIAEPLFTFNTENLPLVNRIGEIFPITNQPMPEFVLGCIKQAEFPIMVIGQYEKGRIAKLKKINENGAILILPEIISGQDYIWRTTTLEQLLPDIDFQPDLVIHIGGNLVNKQLKLYLRKSQQCKVIRIDNGNGYPDTFGHLQMIIRANPEVVISQLSELTVVHSKVVKYRTLLDQYCGKAQEYVPLHFSDIGIMQYLLQVLPKQGAIHIGNSSVVRNATYFFDKCLFSIYCNRGVNGIEGSLSTAVGYALKNDGMTFVLIGDLSFFYDQNALWNTQIPKELRIVLFNNGGGQIFYRLQGATQSSALNSYIAASHQTSAKGVIENYGFTYLSANNYEEVKKGMDYLMQEKVDNPMLLEVFTNSVDNEDELKQIIYYYKHIESYGKKME